MKVEIYIGLGTGAKRIWSGALDCLPRINEEMVIGNKGYMVEFIHHHLTAKPKDPGSGQLVKLYVR